MLIRLDAVPPEQPIEAFPFYARMGCRFSNLSAMAAQNFLEVSPGSLPTASLLRFSPRECAEAGIGNPRCRHLHDFGGQIPHVDSFRCADDAGTLDGCAKLPYVARPIVLLHRLHRSRSEASEPSISHGRKFA